jgi:DNA adenine methylase
MSIILYQGIADRFWLNPWIVRSWCEIFWVKEEKKIITLFEQNRDIINAKPFVKWVGGKRQLIKQFEQFFPTEFGDYFEPFLGGGAVFFNLQKKKSYLSDINEELINTYQTVKDSPEELIAFLSILEHSKKCYETIRAWDRVKDWQKKHTNIERAGRFIYLNRTCFNGLHRVNSRGEFNVPMGAYKNPDFVQATNIRNTSELLRRTEAEIKLESFEHVLKKAKKGDFIYLDPPYDTLTETANFTSYNKDSFGRDMQIKLAETFQNFIITLSSFWLKFS